MPNPYCPGCTVSCVSCVAQVHLDRKGPIQVSSTCVYVDHSHHLLSAAAAAALHCTAHPFGLGMGPIPSCTRLFGCLATWLILVLVLVLVYVLFNSCY